MSKTEYDIIEGIFYDGGSIKSSISPLVDEVSFLAVQNTDKEGKIYLRDLKGGEVAGVTDNKGHYIYVRYNGTPRVEGKDVTVPLRAVLIFPGAANIQQITINILSLIKTGGRGAIGGAAGIQYNRQTIFNEETGLAVENLKTDLTMSVIDFDVLVRVPPLCTLPTKENITTNCC